MILQAVDSLNILVRVDLMRLHVVGSCYFLGHSVIAKFRHMLLI